MEPNRNQNGAGQNEALIEQGLFGSVVSLGLRKRKLADDTAYKILDVG